MTEYRRSRHLVAHWGPGSSRVVNYATGTFAPASAEILSLLGKLERWASLTKLARELPWIEEQRVEELVEILLEREIVESIARAARPPERAFESWRDWNPAAGFFHQATRDVPYALADQEEGPILDDRPRASPLKSHSPALPVTELGDFRRGGAFEKVLLDRRSWRRFAETPVPLGCLSTLLGYTFGVQSWIHLGPGTRLALKSSPSGGAKHSLEAYVLARRVTGLPSGVYHYGPDRHVLTRLPTEPGDADLAAFFPAQAWFQDPPLVVFMTSVFARVQAKYTFARAYRVVLLEAGHLCQTFCLAATDLGLAPFCTAALGDSAVETFLGIDGIGESVLYAAGVGRRPSGSEWAPSPPGDPDPRRSEPAWMERFREETDES